MSYEMPTGWGVLRAKFQLQRDLFANDGDSSNRARRVTARERSFLQEGQSRAIRPILVRVVGGEENALGANNLKRASQSASQFCLFFLTGLTLTDWSASAVSQAIHEQLDHPSRIGGLFTARSMT